MLHISLLVYIIAQPVASYWCISHRRLQLWNTIRYLL